MTPTKTPKHTRWQPEEEEEIAIPRQWLPAAIRWPLRLIVLPFVWLDLGSQWLARQLIRPPYQQEGTCLKRGNCCRYILLPVPKGLLTRFFYFWNTQVNGFFPRRSRPVVIKERRMAVMGCRHLKTCGRCNTYRTRPMVCRQWPLIKHFGRPVILKGCGFRASNK